MPEPLVPAHVDLRDFPFMPLDVARLRDSAIVDEVSGDEFRAAILLWCASWHQVPAGSLPNDTKQLSKFAGYGRVVSEWEKVAEGALYGWVECSDGRLYHPVVAEKAIEAWEKKAEFSGKAAARAEQAKAAAEARWGKKESSGGGEGGGSGHLNGAGNGSDADASSQQCDSMPDALPKYKGQGQGDRRDRETPRSARDPAGRRQPDDVEIWVRALVDGEHPVSVDPDVTPIRALLAEPGIVRADVEEGIAAFIAKSRKRARSWTDFERWIRVAAKDRIAGTPRAASRNPDAPPPLPDAAKIRQGQVLLAAAHFRGEWRSTWPNSSRPEHPDCTLPEDVIDEARSLVEMERAVRGKPEEYARYHGFALTPVH